MLPKVNNVFRLTRDPEIIYSKDGALICKVGLAASEKYGDKEIQFFIDGTAFKKTAEFLNTVLKGHRIFISGKLQTDTWEKDGQRHSKISMIIEHFDYIEKKHDNQNNTQEPDHMQHRGMAPQQYQPQQMPENTIPEIDIQDSEIPF